MKLTAISARPFALPLVPFVVCVLLSPARAATFVVDTVEDAADAAPGNGVCAASSGRCTLRAAIEEANRLPGKDAIEFNIERGEKYLHPASPLPPITEAVVIDGNTQLAESGSIPGVRCRTLSGHPCIELIGKAEIANGLVIRTTGATVRGLVISKFGRFGIRIQGGGGNRVEGNFLGTSIQGNDNEPNGIGGLESGGVGIFDSASNIIGGPTPAEMNLISGNRGAGVAIWDTIADQGQARGNLIQGNLIGTTLDGAATLGNSTVGVAIIDAPLNTLSGNVISGNGEGVSITDSGGTNADASGNSVQGNSIGTDPAGVKDLGNSMNGVRIAGAASGNSVSGNLISGNGGAGVQIAGSGLFTTADNSVQGNFIGTGSGGLGALPNGGSGVLLRGSADRTTISGNVISCNGGSGVELQGSSNDGNQLVANRIGTFADGAVPPVQSAVGVKADDGTSLAILQNSIFAHAGLGISLGPDGLQNLPVLAAVSLTPQAVTITGTLDGSPGADFTIEFFASRAGDDSGYGEGERYLGSIAVTTDGGGKAAFSASLAAPVAAGEFITATATDSGNRTSEFSKWIQTGAARFSLTATAGDGGTTLAWDPVAGADSYDLYLALESGVGPENYETLAGGTRRSGVASPFSLDGLENGKVYYLMLVALSGGVELTRSVEAEAKPFRSPFPLWKPADGLPRVRFHALALDRSSGEVAYASGGGKVYRSEDGGGTWSALPGPGGDIRALAASGPLVYAATVDGDIQRSTDRGDSWELSVDGEDIGEQRKVLALDPEAPLRIYAADLKLPDMDEPEHSFLIRSVDGGESWEHLPESTDEIRAYALAFGADRALYAGGGGTPQLVKSLTGGDSWVDVSLPAEDAVYSLAAHPSEPGTIYLGTRESGVYRSADAGESWEPRGRGLPAEAMTINALLIDPRSPDSLLAGTRAGVHHSPDGGESWQPLHQGFTGEPPWIEALALTASGRIIAATAEGLFVNQGSSRPPSPRFHRGDPDSSGAIDISDGIAVFGFLFLGDAAPACKESADADNDGGIDISDGIFLLNWLFIGGPEPAPPGPTSSPCGPDPDLPGSPADLGCEAYGPCSD